MSSSSMRISPWIGFRGMNVKGAAGESSEGNEKHIVGTRKEREPSYTVGERLAELCASCMES